MRTKEEVYELINNCGKSYFGKGWLYAKKEDISWEEIDIGEYKKEVKKMGGLTKEEIENDCQIDSYETWYVIYENNAIRIFEELSKPLSYFEYLLKNYPYKIEVWGYWSGDDIITKYTKGGEDG